MGTIDLHTDGPHSDDYTREIAGAFAESVRVLNYATLPDDQPGLTYPATVCDVLGMLAAGSARLDQLLRQMQSFLRAELAAGRLGDDRARGGDPAATVAAVIGGMKAAQNAAGALSRSLKDAQDAGAYLHGRNGGGER